MEKKQYFKKVVKDDKSAFGFVGLLLIITGLMIRYIYNNYNSFDFFDSMAIFPALFSLLGCAIFFIYYYKETREVRYIKIKDKEVK